MPCAWGGVRAAPVCEVRLCMVLHRERAAQRRVEAGAPLPWSLPLLIARDSPRVCCCL